MLLASPGAVVTRMAEASHHSNGQPWQCRLGTNRDRISLLLTTGNLSDVTLVFSNNTHIKAHRLILAMGSPVLEAMMYGPLATHGDLALNADPFEVFIFLLNYLYLDEINLPDLDMAMRVYHLAHKYQVDTLSEACSKYLVDEVQPETVPRIFDTAMLLEDNFVLQRCIELLVVSPERVLQSRDVSHLGRSSLWHILTHPRLCVSSETIIFNAVINWGTENMDTESNASPVSQDVEEEHGNYLELANPGQDREQLGSGVASGAEGFVLKLFNRRLRQTVEEFLPLVRFLNMTLHEMVTCVFPSGILTGDESVALVLNLKGKHSALPYFVSQTTVGKRESSMKTTVLSSLNSAYGSSTQFTFHNQVTVNLLRNFMTTRTVSLVKISAICTVSLQEGVVNIWNSANEIVGRGTWQGTSCSFRRPVRLLPTKAYTISLTLRDAMSSTGANNVVSVTHQGTGFSGQTLCNGKIVIDYYLTDDDTRRSM
ncbi:BTB/POZ domain-containing protein 2 isoform X2 [Procambarus clarkii]|uniref:BTB/POZ domain-containing protein 2 isoform X2 n=1 Tax=Procambarus clarkii TaxID=6728 RepID=UPI003744A4AD